MRPLGVLMVSLLGVLRFGCGQRSFWIPRLLLNRPRAANSGITCFAMPRCLGRYRLASRLRELLPSPASM